MGILVNHEEPAFSKNKVVDDEQSKLESGRFFWRLGMYLNKGPKLGWPP
jgi:hypothetical protein